MYRAKYTLTTIKFAGIKTMKRLITSILAFAMLISLCGCGKQDDTHLSPEEYNDLLAGVTEDELTDDAGLTILLCGPTTNDVEVAIHDYEILNGIEINVIKYGEGKWDQFVTKALAQDKDFDLFMPVPAQIPGIIISDAYQDLSGYPDIKSRLYGNDLVKSLADYDGTLIGVPCCTQLNYSSDSSSSRTLFKYGYKNINTFTGEYSDPDGEELFEVLKHLYNNPEDTREDQFYDFEYYGVMTQYVFMNRSSQHKDAAASFLCYLYDILNKDIESAAYLTYPEVEEGIEHVPGWLFWPADYIEPFSEAKEEALKSDGSDEAIRKIAQEAALGFRMRLEG